MIENPIAFRKLKAVDAKGKAFDLEIIVGHPYEVDEHEWSCPVTLKGLYKLGPISGVDSLQALMLALGLVKSLLDDFCEKGGKIYYLNEDKPVSIVELLHL
jgi:hypothetical protein